MRRKTGICWVVLFATIAISNAGRSWSGEAVGGRDGYIVDLGQSPHAAMQNVPLTSVRWTGGFWAERYRQAHEVTLRRLWELLADPEKGHVIDNMRIAAGLQEGEYAGTNWQDAWAYKWIEAASCFYRQTGDPWIEARMDELIDLIGQAQEDDGYVSTQITARNTKRFQNAREHEVYTMGHLLTAGVIHHRMTGKDSLLKIARKNGDFLCRTLGVTIDPHFAHNPSAIMGLVELYRETGERRYLDCARRIVDARGSKPRKGWGMWGKWEGINGTDYIQDRVPLRKSTEVVGHNVFFTYLFCGATDVYMETGDETLMTALKRLWRDLTERKMCINGGISPVPIGLSNGHPVVEAAGPPYFLPCASSYNETCGQIGNFMWNFRMLCAEESAAYADVMEQEIYNGILPGIGLEGRSWFYRTPLRRYDKDYQQSGLNDLPMRSEPGRRQICCPTNLLRTVAQFQSYVYSVSDGGVWIHHYGGNEFSTNLKEGETAALVQKTDYPWDGKVIVSVKQAPDRAIFINLRIPGWAEGATIRVNGKPIAEPQKAGAYASIERKWAAGDTIELNLPMEPRLMQAHPKAEELRNQVAVMRGPVLYCLESPDVDENIDLSNVYLPSDLNLEPVGAEDLPFEMKALKGNALYRAEPSWEGTLYRRLGSQPLKPIEIRMIPYFAWANRGRSTMTAWLPVILKM